MTESQLAAEYVEGVGAAHRDRPEVEHASAMTCGLQPPVAVPEAPQAGDELRRVSGQVGGFLDFEPEFGYGGIVDDFEAFDDRLTGLDAVTRARHPNANALSRRPGPGAGQRDTEEQGVTQPLGQPVVGGEADGEGHDRQGDDDAQRSARTEGRPPGAAEGAAQGSAEAAHGLIHSAGHERRAVGHRPCHDAARAPGTGTRSSTSSITVRASWLRTCADGLRMIRCPSAGCASVLMSSGIT